MFTTQLLPRVRSAVLFIRPNTDPSRSTLDAVAERLLAGPLTVLLALYTLGVFVTWLPGYLTWPMWADHDVFATLARGWSDGRLPYRDLPTTNFPGPIYQAWLFGHLFGWGHSQVVYAFDAVLLFGLAGSCVAWSRVRLGWYLPGTLAAAVLVSYHATLDFSLAAQRDWQAASFVLLGLLAVAGRTRPRWSLVACAALCAFALVSRPQAVLLMPAVAVAVWFAGGVRSFGLWLMCGAAFVGLLFLPLVAHGLIPDFVREMGRIGEGGIYRHPGVDRLEIYQEQAVVGGVLALVAGYAFLWLRGRPAVPLSLLVWPVAALAGAWFYKPLSPFPHRYLVQPYHVALAAFGMAVVAGLLRSPTSATVRLVAVLAMIGSSVDWRPNFCEVTHLGRTWRAVTGRASESYVPSGYTRRGIPNQHVYPWACYRRLTEYLRTQTSPDTPVANLLLSPAAVNGDSGRRTPLHAESMMWVIIVGRDDLDGFAKELLASPESLVVWRPREWEEVPTWERVPRMLREKYERVTAFDEIEVWRRKADAVREGSD
ncbi:hypothetical protein [Limnoglobus roseus]|uniref:Glycosyltransferase RgtA/B/C/D-like domain-containing protein n=1 Tax=Limnoglobus roseus TaxID=2598579 RepID=A0A5C1ACY5_9BACT|nr:hypothetical protein [Limnoglobus roseus]QEL15856.1 hypothetical protein PX52LOC_02792 [Limnoglobus roseus]